MQITLEEFRTGLLGMKGSTIVTLHTETIPAMKKTDNPYVGMVKASKVNGIINWGYELAVNRQRLREGLETDFSAYPRKWGQRVKGTPLVEHKGNHYLEVKVQAATCSYFVGMVEVNHADVSPWLRPASPHRQGVDKEVILRDYALENIKSVTWGGETYQIS
jgi:hypothetical protein